MTLHPGAVMVFARRAGVALLALVALSAGSDAHAYCGPIDGTYPLFAGGELDVKNNITMNAAGVTIGKRSPDAYVALDGSRGEGDVTFNALDPETFPPNPSTTNADESASPFVSATDVYYQDVTVNQNETITFTGGGPFHMSNLKVKKNATVNFAAGIYYIDTWEMKEDTAVINVTSEPVIIHIGTKVNMDSKDLTINAGGNVTGLRVFLHAGAKMNEDTKGDRLDFTGLVYGPASGEVGVGKNATFHGAIITRADVKVEGGTAFTYGASDQAAVSAIATCSGPGTDHFGIEHDGVAQTCLTEPVVIRRHTATHDVDTTYAGTITLSTSTATGDWAVLVGAGTLSNAGSGAATYTYSASDQGVVVLGIDYTVEETFNIDATDGSVSEYSGKDDDITVGTCTGGGSCGFIPGDYPIYGATSVTVGNALVMNGSAVAAGAAGPHAVVAIDGSRADPVPQAFPDFDPPTFPVNPSGVDADEADSPLDYSTEVYFKNVTANDGATVRLEGGGPYHIGELKWEDDSTIELEAGIYYIDKMHMHGDRATLTVLSEPVIFMVGDELRNHGLDQVVNLGGNVVGFRMYLYAAVDSSAATETSMDFTGLIFGPATGTVDMGGGALTMRGAIISGGTVNVGNNASWTYTVADQAAVNALSTCAAGSVDHFYILHDGTGVNCQAEPITIRAHEATHLAASAYSGTITVATSTGHGDWTLQGGSGVLTNSGGGAATYAFDVGDGGEVVLGLKNTFAETVNLDVVDGGGATESSGSAIPAEDLDLVFDTAGFVFLADGVKNTIATQIAGKGSNLAPGAQTIELQAVKTNGETGACEAALAGANTIELAAECSDPGACSARQVSISGASIAGNNSGPIAAYTGVSLDFGDDTDTTATITVSYPDAGLIRLHARYDIPLGGGGASGNTMVGSSNAFVVRPFGFDVDFADDRQINGTAGVSYAADGSGSPFAKAGASFDATVTAVVWAPADDADADGFPDAGANLSDNAATINFGQEASAPTALLTHALAEPWGGSPGTLTGGGAIGGFSAGAATASLAFDEVGIVDLVAASADYLGSGAAVVGTAGNVGRFYPARFAVADAGFALRNGRDAGWACGFTYMNQPFAYASDPVLTLTAQNTSGATTDNYGGDFFKLGAPFLAARVYSDASGAGATLDAPATGTVSLSGNTDYDGDGDLTISDELFAYNRPGALLGPFGANIDLTVDATDLEDADGVCYDPVNAACNTNEANSAADYAVTAIAGASLRFGRLRLLNAAGSELLALTQPMRAEYFDGSGFVVNGADGCTSISTTAMDLASAVQDPAPGTSTVTITNTPGAGTTTGTIANAPLTAGLAGLGFSAPGAGLTGYADVTFDLSTATGADQEWLRFDWDGDGAHDDDPGGRATFGIFSGADAIIFVGEPWN